jgi:hypothetical protein
MVVTGRAAVLFHQLLGGLVVERGVGAARDEKTGGEQHAVAFHRYLRC